LISTPRQIGARNQAYAHYPLRISIRVPSRRRRQLASGAAKTHRDSTAAQDFRSGLRELLERNTIANQRRHKTEPQASLGDPADRLPGQIRHGDCAFGAE
jgi:hypothetical protein